MFYRQVFEKMNKEGVVQVLDFLFHAMMAFPQFQMLNFGPITKEGYLQIHINWNSIQLIVAYKLGQELKFPENPTPDSFQEFMENFEFISYVQCPLCQQWISVNKEELVNFYNCKNCEGAAQQQFQQAFQSPGAKTTLFGAQHISHTGVNQPNVPQFDNRQLQAQSMERYYGKINAMQNEEQWAVPMPQNLPPQQVNQPAPVPQQPAVPPIQTPEQENT